MFLLHVIIIEFSCYLLQHESFRCYCYLLTTQHSVTFIISYLTHEYILRTFQYNDIFKLEFWVLHKGLIYSLILSFVCSQMSCINVRWRGIGMTVCLYNGDQTWLMWMYWQQIWCGNWVIVCIKNMKNHMRHVLCSKMFICYHGSANSAIDGVFYTCYQSMFTWGFYKYKSRIHSILKHITCVSF